MTADEDWIESSLSAAANSNPQIDGALREMVAALLSNTISQKALSKSELSVVATELLAAISVAEAKPAKPI